MKLKPLVRMMAMLPAMALPGITALHASDLSIYKPNSGGKTSILLMLDTSGSMGISSLVLPKNNAYGSPGDVDSSLCTPVDVAEKPESGSDVKFKEWAYNAKPAGSTKTAFKKTISINGKNIDYYLRGCGTATVDSTGNLVESTTGKFDRLSRLKDAVIQLLADQSLDNQVRIGLGHYSNKTNINVGDTANKLVDGHSGKILVPVAELTPAHREKLITELAALKSVDTTTNEDGTDNRANLRLTSRTYPNIFKASSGTPTAHAYAEAGAYMMGTTTGIYPRTLPTKTSILYDGYSIIKNNNTGEQLYYVCVGLDGKTGNAFGATSMFCDNQWNRGMDSSYPGKFYDNNGPGALRVNNKDESVVIYKPNGNGGWLLVKPADYKKEPDVLAHLQKQGMNANSINNVWTLHKSLPIGWRWGGWMKVENEPMDIEPIGAKVWDHHGSDTKNMVSYRSSPFSLESVNKVPYENMVGGFMYADASLKDGSNYKAGGIASECNGNGVYFLTDGAPNSTKQTMAQSIINLTLHNNEGATASEQNKFKFNAKPSMNVLVSPKLQASVFLDPDEEKTETGGWEYIGEYAKKLRNPLQNPKKMAIKTAVVGFGSSFAGIPKNANGTYNCEKVKDSNLDAYNACKWGQDGYGEGGFYYAENVEDIKSSIMEFVNKVQVPFTATSLGSVSIPRDPLDQTQIVTEGFFPMISPMDDSEAAAGQKYMTWAGNLKKYKIVDGTLKDKNNNAIYITENNQQKINSTAQDLWSIASTSDDHSDIMSGGSLNKIPVPSLLNITGQPSNSNSVRNVYTIDGTTLKKVTKSNVATDITGTNALSNSITVEQRYALLNYLGYVAPTTSTTLTTAQLNNLLTVPASPYRHMGGVVHSTPVLATKEVKISSGDNAIESRKEYVVYGTMEGGLHIVDASTGEEKSVFVPKEILTSQAATLANKDPRGNGLAYGVDAPWAIDSQYKVKTTTDVITQTVTTAYEANILRAYGGLRMGGIGFYGLNISDVTAPELLFHIDRSKSGFERIAQIWSKPTITEIRHEGKRKHVLILGGGYDADKYENETVENPSSLPTMGNALYVIDAETGELIWSTSSMISDQNATSTINETKNVDVKYSVVAQPAVRDYDSDGLADMIYFADLGGQIFRVDLNNLAHMNTTKRNIAVRVQKIANLAEANFVPRFYDRVTTAVFGSGNERHVFVSVGSGNRSFPLKGSPVKNKVYGILDYDAAKNGLEKTGFNTFQAVATMGASSNMLNRGSVGKNSSGANTLTLNGVTVTTANGKTNLNDTNKVSLLSNGTKRGWYFELTSTGDGTPAGSFYAKAFEEPQLVVGDLYVSVYDPKASLGTTTSSCGGGVQGVSTIHRLCAPYGDCAANVTTGYQGIIGSTLGGLTNPARTTQLIGPITPAGEKCVGRCDKDNQTADDQPLKKYSQRRVIRPTRWFEW